MPHERLNEGEKNGLYRKVVPVSIEGRSEQEHCSIANAPFSQRDVAVIEPREHGISRRS
jgi:hypothetical protein